MQKLSQILTLTLVLSAGAFASVANQTDRAAFLAQIDTCQMTSASHDLPLCVFGQNHKKSVSDAQVQVELQNCVSRNLGTPQDVTACVNQRLAKPSLLTQVDATTVDHIFSQCSKGKGTAEDVVSCTHNEINRQLPSSR